MFSLKSRFARLSAGLVVTTALTLGAAMPAFAADTSVVSGALNGGSLTATVAIATLAAVNYAHVIPASAGTLVLTVDDTTATGAGWGVTIQSGDFTYAGANAGATILADNFSITVAGPAAPVVGTTGSQAVSSNANEGPLVPATISVGTLNAPRTVIQAYAGFGQGNYTQNIPVSLTYPAQSRAGTYTATLTTSLIAAPV